MIARAPVAPAAFTIQFGFSISFWFAYPLYPFPVQKFDDRTLELSQKKRKKKAKKAKNFCLPEFWSILSLWWKHKHFKVWTLEAGGRMGATETELDSEQ